nr:iron-sulfur cluster assembly protein 1-like [Ipomoea batatas]
MNFISELQLNSWESNSFPTVNLINACVLVFLLSFRSPECVLQSSLLTSCFSFPATEWVKGKQMEEVLSIKNTEIAKHLSLPPVKLHCSMLAEDAIKAAVKDYEAKRANTLPSDATTA